MSDPDRRSHAADLARLNSGAPLLFNHDYDDILGVVERAYIKGDQGRALVRFGKDARGEWAMQQAADGVLVNVSCTYRVTAPYRDGPNGELIADHWEAIEISLVTVPADRTVGIGRSINTKGTMTMESPTAGDGLQLSRSQRARQHQQQLESDLITEREGERQRMLEIAAMGRKYKIPEAEVLEMQRSGLSVDEARARVADVVMRRASDIRPAVDYSVATGEIGMGAMDVSRFSLVRAINAMLTADWRHAGLERAASTAVEEQLGRRTQGIFVPLEVMQRTPWQTQNRATYQVGTPAQGGNIVATNLAVDYFTEALRNQTQVIQAGATMLTGLVGNVDIPRRVTTTPTYWVGESSAVTEGEATFDKIQLRPRTLGALSRMSRLMMLQSTPAIESLTRADLVWQMGLGLDKAALIGTGTNNEPQGIANTPGIGSVVGGTNGASITLDHLVDLETKLADSNAPTETRAYMLNTKAIAALKKLKSSTGQYLWTTDAPGQRSGTPPSFGSYSVFPTNQLRSNLTKGTASGVCSELIFGAWSELIIGQWGTLEVIANPFDASGFASGDVVIRSMLSVDVQVRHPVSFAVMADALTA